MISASGGYEPMDYRNTEMKLDQLVGYFNEEKINLSPVFQRGKVWTLPMRKELLKNIVRHRPIPAIFLYKDATGAKYTYNILDGKQRLESMIMFIGSANPNFAIKTWGKYIFGSEHRRNVGFPVDLKDGKGDQKFSDFDENIIRELREYTIPTIEIVLNDNTNLDEIINLFVDINQRGVKVTRLNIVRALRQKDPLLEEVYKMVAAKQQRMQDVYTKKKGTIYVNVLKRLNIITAVTDTSVQADRMWERLLELALFVRSGGRHRKPSEILKTFIKGGGADEYNALTKEERRTLKRAFAFLSRSYDSSDLGSTRLATDQTHFYIMATALLGSKLLDTFSQEELTKKLVRFSGSLGGFIPRQFGIQEADDAIQRYRDLSTEKTTDTSRRKERQQNFIKAVELL